MMLASSASDEAGASNSAVISPILQAILASSSERGSSAGSQARSSATNLVTQYIHSSVGRQQSVGSSAPVCQGTTLESERSTESVQALREQIQRLTSERDELAQQLQRLSKQLEMMREAIHKMKIGLSRHHSEKLAPEQLELALESSDESQQQQPRPDSGSSGEAEPSSPNDNGDKSDKQTDKKPRKRAKHGRARIERLPKVIDIVLPDEVVQDGLKHFECIGYEDKSTIGYRRGGPFELITRRVKFVRAESHKRAAPGPAVTPSAVQLTGPDSPLERSTGSKCVPSGLGHTIDGSPAFCEQLVPTQLPGDTALGYHNPFVDGALIRYRPDGNQTSRAGPVLIAPLPVEPLEKALPDASLLAHLFVEKHSMHVPYYRQQQRLARHGHRISRTNMSRWQLLCGQLLEPLVRQMWREALDRPWFAMDATSTALQASGKLERGYVHVMVSEAHSVLYRFSEKNDGDTLVELFGGARGIILADSSTTHNGLFGQGKAQHAGCWAHARRHFVQAFRANEGPLAAEVLLKMQQLFRIEAQARDLSPGERLAKRILEAKPIVNQLIDMAEQNYQTAEPDTHTRAGFVYLHNQAPALRLFLSDGNVPMHNNVSERALRRMVKGRITGRFHGSANRARAACNIASVVASAEHLGLDPEFYLQELLSVLPAWPVRRILELAPENWLATRARLLKQGSLTYLDIATITGNLLRFPNHAPQPN